jgi:hypothetical protein
MELVLPQIQETILDQKAGSYRKMAPTQSWGFETSVLFSSLCTAFWTSGLTPTENVENGGAHTPTASSAPSDLETFMRLLYLTTIVVNFQEAVFPHFQEAIFPHFQEAVFPHFFFVVARLTSGNHQQVPLLIQLSLSHTHYFIWSMCPYRKCADIRGTDQVKP